jgi:hypothetical protein
MELATIKGVLGEVAETGDRAPGLSDPDSGGLVLSARRLLLV